jgi:transposase
MRARRKKRVALTIKITLNDLRKTSQRIKHQSLDQGDWRIIDALVDARILREEKKQERLEKKLAATLAAEAARAVAAGEVIDADFRTIDDDPAAATSTEGRANGTTGALPEATPKPAENAETTSDGRRKGKTAAGDGHGRNGNSAFTNAQHVFHALLAGVIGMLCEKCGKANMTVYREKVTVRIVGQPIFGAICHHFEQARCRMCGHIIRAKAPPEVFDGVGTGYIVYHWTACAMLAVLHYFAGMPFKRLESLHAGWGIPMPDANQWRVVNDADDHLLLLFAALERWGMRTATNLRIDDTGTVVLEVMREIRTQLAVMRALGEEDAVRNGVNATGVHLETPDGIVILYYSGLHHAGEILDLLWKYRVDIEESLVKVTDGASKNFGHGDADKLIEAICNAHAFLKFRAIKDKHPVEYALAGAVYKQVFDNDDIAKAKGMTSEERRDFHQAASKPLMLRLLAMCQQKITERLVEPNAPLWEPVSFIVNQWPRLTRFCDVPGVPLDTNLVEQDLITVSRYLGASFNYQTTNGSGVGDRYMSLVMSARANGAEPVAYLAHCLENHVDLKKRPAHYLPWAYAARMKTQAKPPDVQQT